MAVVDNAMEIFRKSHGRSAVRSGVSANPKKNSYVRVVHFFTRFVTRGGYRYKTRRAERTAVLCFFEKHTYRTYVLFF